MDEYAIESPSPLSWPQRAIPTQQVFYRAAQPFEIYAEDQGAHMESIYEAVLARDARLHGLRVSCVGSRTQVLALARELDRTTPRLFIVDGDMNSLLQNETLADPRIVVLRTHHIENVLMDDLAIAEVSTDLAAGTLHADEIAERLDLGGWQMELRTRLESIVVLFATVSTLPTPPPTLSKCPGSLTSDLVLDRIRLSNELRGLRTHASTSGLRAVRRRVRARIRQLDSVYRWVPGKVMLLPLLERRIRAFVEGSIRRDFLRFSLARRTRSTLAGELVSDVVLAAQAQGVTL